MPLISITRLRIRRWWFLPVFFFDSLRASRQARRSAGCLDVALLADAKSVFWTRTVWTDEHAMKAFLTAQPHLAAMKKLPKWCDEAAVVHWFQESAAIPDWQEAYRRLLAEGRRTKVSQPSSRQDSFQFPPPVSR